MDRRKLIGLAVSLAALAATAAPATAAPARPDPQPDQIIAVLIGLKAQPHGPDSVGTTGLKVETEVTDY
jgi:hypothetical protein